MKKILLVGDSLSMVRPLEGIGFEDLFITKLNIVLPGMIIISGALRSNNTQNILKDNYMNEYVIPLSPDIVIFQMGIVDASPRIFTQNEKMILSILSRSKLLKPVIEKIIKYKSERRYEFTRKRPISAVSLQDFKSNINNFFAICRSYNPDTQFVIVNICKPGEIMIERNFGIVEQISAYNLVLKDFCESNKFEIIDCYKYTLENPDSLLSDGYHITANTHEFLFNQIQSKLEKLLKN